jgi:hypothetical protein
MRQNNKIDYTAEPIGEEEFMIRLLCSPLYYDKATHIVSAEAFNLRMMGREANTPEQYASLGRKKVLEAEETLDGYLQVGYKVWDDKAWETNEYTGYGTFLCADALKVNPKRIEINSLCGGQAGHVGMFYVKSETEYFKGPLPMEDAEIAEMLGDLSALIADSIAPAPKKKA